jgi:tetratricopeptide (TPR) repeat protein
MNGMKFYKRSAIIVMAVLCLAMIPAAASPETPAAPPTGQRFPADAAASFHLPPGEEEQRLAGDAAALAALKHRQAARLYREYRQAGDMKKLYTALNTAGEAIRLAPDRSGYWVTLGDIHTELDRLNIPRSSEYAEDAFRQSLALAPQDAYTMVLLAVNLAKTGEYEEALDHFEKAASTDILVLSADIAQWMNACYLADAQTMRGAIFYGDLQKKNPGYHYLNLYKAVLYQAHFDHASARRELTELINRPDADRATREQARRLLGEMGGKGGKKS